MQNSAFTNVPDLMIKYMVDASLNGLRHGKILNYSGNALDCLDNIPDRTDVSDAREFLQYSLYKRFDTILLTPFAANLAESCRQEAINLLSSYMIAFDQPSDLYLFFIYKSVLHLQEGGELICLSSKTCFDDDKSSKFNRFLYENGTITNVVEGVLANCLIWRFEKGNFTRKTRYEIDKDDDAVVTYREMSLGKNETIIFNQNQSGGCK